jgi:alkyl hydroperoxide reductase subunit AhpF
VQELSENNPFDSETWALLSDYFENLPRRVQINVWGDPDGDFGEREANRVAAALSARFAQIEAAFFPRRANYAYYPVIGIFDLEGEAAIDKGVRIVGLPSGYQMTSLIAAIQAVAFQGTTLEARTRIRLQALNEEINLELLTAANDEAGTLVAKSAFGLAVASPFIRTFLIMTDSFPVANVRYSVSSLPHLVINGRIHIQGVVEEEALLKQIAAGVK